METGWRHDDSRSQREFERLGPEKSQSTQREQTSGIPVEAPGRTKPGTEITVTSPTGTIDVTVKRRPGTNRFEIERPLTVSQSMVPVQTDPVTQRTDNVSWIDFRAGDNVELSVYRHDNGRVVVEIASAVIGGGGMTSWFLEDAFSAATEITDGETVVFTGTGAATVSRAGNTINVDVPASSYSWRASGGFDSPMTISNTEVVYFAAADSTIVVTQLDSGTFSQILFSRPLTLRRTTDNDTIEFSTANTITDIYFENDVAAKPAGYTKRAWVDVSEAYAGAPGKIEIWYEDLAGAGAYDWDLQADTGGTETIASGVVVDIAGGTDIETVLTGTGPYVVTINSTYIWQIDHNSSGSPADVTSGVIVDLIAGSDISIARSGTDITISSTYSYSWNLQANSGPTTPIDNGETVNFIGTGTATVSRSGNDIIIDVPVGGYSWTVSDGSANEVIGTGDTVNFVGGTNITTTYDAGTNTLTIDADPYPVYSWFLDDNTSGLPTEISDGETVDFIGGTNITVVRAGNAITINADPYPDYDWTASDGSVTELVSDGESIIWTGTNGVDVSLTAGTFTIDRPLTLRRTTDTDTIDFSTDSEIVDIYLENDAATKPAGYTKRAWIDVTNPTTGRAKLEIWYEDLAGAGAYDWDLQADTGGPSTIPSGAIVDIAGGIGVSTSLAGVGPFVVTIDRPLTLHRTTDTDTVEVSTDNEITDIYFENTVNTKPAAYTKRAWIDVVNPIPGRAKVEIWYEDETGAGAYDWTVSDGFTSEIVASGSTIFWVGGTDITTSYDTGTNTMTISSTYVWELDVNTSGSPESIISGTVVNLIEGANVNIVRSGADITISTDPYPDYNWLLAAEGVVGTEDIGDGETVTFRAVGTGLAVDRTTNTITYSRLPDDATDPNTGKRVKVGYVEWDLTGIVAPTNGLYGDTQIADIVHGWDLINMHMFTLYVSDVTFQEDPSDPGFGTDIDYYRSPATTLAGETPPNQTVRLFPYAQAHDADTVRLWITHTRNFPTVMKMWYVLKEV